MASPRKRREALTLRALLQPHGARVPCGDMPGRRLRVGPTRDAERRAREAKPEQGAHADPPPPQQCHGGVTLCPWTPIPQMTHANEGGDKLKIIVKWKPMYDAASYEARWRSALLPCSCSLPPRRGPRPARCRNVCGTGALSAQTTFVRRSARAATSTRSRTNARARCAALAAASLRSAMPRHSAFGRPAGALLPAARPTSARARAG